MSSEKANFGYIGGKALIKKAATSPLVVITCPSSRFYVQADSICKHLLTR
jgi:hypothetical protein